MSTRPRRPNLTRPKSSEKSHYVTKNGNKIKLHRTMKSKWQARKEARARARAAYLATMPKTRLKRIMFRLHPKRVAKYWASRDGRIMALKLTGVGILAVFLMLVGVFAYFRKDLPDLKGLYGSNTGGSIQYYDRTGKTLLWEDYDAVKRNVVKDEDIAQVMKDATVALEDKDFFKHGGFDVQGIGRAAFNNVTNRESTQGGSTITQQLVKLSQNWSKDRTYTRKIKELILAVELERTYTKQEILAGYLNTAPYSDITYGTEAAMQDYFGKSANKITLDEAAFLAAIPKSPTLYSPYGARYDKQSLLDRQDYVLDLMAEQGKITDEEKDKAKAADTLKKLKKRKPKYSGIKAPWFVLTAKEHLQTKYGAETVLRGGWKVTTTLDMEKQKIAEQTINDNMWRVRAAGGDTAAFVGENVETGQVEALVGGSDFNNKEFGENNYARLKLPPGSSFKPYDYLGLIEHSDQYGAGTVLYDVQEPIDGYPCTVRARPPTGNCLFNYDFRYPGPLTLRYALGGSRNVPAVKSMAITGVDKTIETANKLGLKDTGDDDVEGHGYKCYADDELTEESKCYTSSAIGDGAYLKLDEHVHAMSTISRNGKLIPQTYILKIEDSSGKTVSEWKKSEGKQVVRDEAAYIVADMMSDPRASYFASKSQQYNNHKFSMKTGTTNDSKDGWMMSFSTQYAAGVWVGYHNRQVELSGFMETMTQPMVDGFMRPVHDKLKPKERERPKGIQELPAYVVRNHVGVGSVEPSQARDLFPSWYKKKQAGGQQVIDKVSKKLATNCTPARAKETVFGASAGQLSSDPFHGGSRTVSGNEKDDVHRCEDAKPRVTLTAPSSCNRRCTFTATVNQGTHPISSSEFPGTVNFYVGGQLIKSAQVGSSPATVSAGYDVSSAGSREVKAEVIDSVLYDSSSSRTVSFKKPEAAPKTLKITKAKFDGGDLEFEWSGGNGTVTIRWATNPNRDKAICSGSGDDGCDSGGSPDSLGRTVYAQDSSGNTSGVVTISP
jgi:membrane peptidoglycan carboxypeptidase